MRKILLTGKNGQFGWALQRTLAPLGQVVAVDVGELDLSSPEAIRQAACSIKPGITVNPAVYTTVGKAEPEFEPELAMAINGIAPGVFAEEAKNWARCWCITRPIMFLTDARMSLVLKAMNPIRLAYTEKPSWRGSRLPIPAA